MREFGTPEAITETELSIILTVGVFGLSGLHSNKVDAISKAYEQGNFKLAAQLELDAIAEIKGEVSGEDAQIFDLINNQLTLYVSPEGQVSLNPDIDSGEVMGDNEGQGINGIKVDYTGKPYSGKRNPDVDFTDRKGNSTFITHFDEHAGDFGYITETEYLNGSRDFLEKSPTLTTQSFVTKDGTYFRYDTTTNEFGIMNKYGGVSTYYKPDRGIKYWLEQIELYASKD